MSFGSNVWASQTHQCIDESQAANQNIAIPSDEASLLAEPAEAMHIVADRAEGQGVRRARAEGNVIVERGDDVLNADWVEYDQEKDEIQAGSQFVLTRAGAQTVTGEQLVYRLGQGSGQAQNAQFEMEQNGRRLQGEGANVELQDKQRYAVRNVKLNTCNPGDESWYIQAAELQADAVSGIGTVRHARLVFHGVPILYTPWADFPVNGNRKSGFLVPTLKIGSNGTQFEQPYYFNLAPNYDATLTPGVITSRGVVLGGEFRYLQPQFSGSLNGRYMPSDRKSQVHDHRYEVQALHQHQINENLSAGLVLHQVSDDDYYRDFHGRNDIAANVNLNRYAWLQYQKEVAGAPLNAHLSVQKYQTLSDALGNKDKPYAAVPRLSADWRKNVGNANVNIDAHYARFEHDSKQSGRRVNVYPSITWNFRNQWGYLKPKLGIHATSYWLEQAVNRDNKNSAHRIHRILPIANLDTGMTLERSVNVWGRESLQTLEPRLFYNYIHPKDQSHLPNFDSSQNAFTYEQLFRENLYSGRDRINNSNSLAVGLQSRLLDRSNGAEYFRAGVGQKFYFNEDNVQLDGKIGRTARNRSDIAAFAGGQIGQNWYADGQWHYNENARRTEQFDTGVRYHPQEGKTIAARFKYGRNEEIYSGFFGELKHADFAVQWPISKQLYAVGRLNYSVKPSTWLEQTAGLEYKSKCGCWGASVVAQRYASGLGTYKNAIFFTLKLKDLSNMGNDPTEQLRLAIPGYNKTNEVR